MVDNITEEALSLFDCVRDSYIKETSLANYLVVAIDCDIVVDINMMNTFTNLIMKYKEYFTLPLFMEYVRLNKDCE